MVLIPNDIGIRMRLQAEAQLLQPTSAIAEIAAELPELLPGTLFTARIKDVMPQGTYKALVGGKDITLSLPTSAKPGDTLELVVVDRSAKAIVAELASSAATTEGADNAGGAGKPYPFTRLSSAGQLISTLLPNAGERAAPAPLNAGQPILSAPPTAAAPLAAALQQAIKSSGVFYEAHQAQWVTGRYPLAELLNEPQAQHSDFNRLVGALLTAESKALAATGAGAAATADFAQPLADTLASPAGSAPAAGEAEKSALAGRRSEAAPATASPAEARSAEKAGQPATPSIRGTAESLAPASSATSASVSQRMPDDVRPIVQQQLDALATDRLVWHGEAWPQQVIDLQIERDAQHQGGTDDGPRWNTRLALTTPRLGEVDARLQLSQDGVRIVLHADNTVTAERLREALPELRSALDAAGVPLRGFAVRDASTTDATEAAEAVRAAEQAPPQAAVAPDTNSES